MKFQLDAAIGGGYRFLFGRLLSIIGTVWLPYLVLIGGCAGLAYLVLPHGVFRGDLSGLQPYMLLDPQLKAISNLSSLLGMVISAMITVQLMRHALGLKETTTFVYFSLSGVVWRMLVAFFLGGLILVPVILVAVLAGIAGGVAMGIAVSGHLQWWQGGAISAGLGIIIAVLFIYVIARLFFFLPAVVVAEGKIGIGRSWQLGKGNVGRIILVWLCIAVPIWIVVLAFLGGTVGPVIYSDISHWPQKPSTVQVRTLFWDMLRLIPYILPGLIAAGIAMRGYMAGAIGTAYKAVTAPKEESA